VALPDDRPERDVLPPTRGGKWRGLDQPGSVSLRDLKIGEDLIHFLDWHKQVGGHIFTNARSFALTKRYTAEQNDLFRRLLDMYLQKYPEKTRGHEESA